MFALPPWSGSNGLIDVSVRDALGVVVSPGDLLVRVEVRPYGKSTRMSLVQVYPGWVGDQGGDPVPVVVLFDVNCGYRGQYGSMTTLHYADHHVTTGEISSQCVRVSGVAIGMLSHCYPTMTRPDFGGRTGRSYLTDDWNRASVELESGASLGPYCDVVGQPLSVGDVVLWWQDSGVVLTVRDFLVVVGADERSGAVLLTEVGGATVESVRPEHVVRVECDVQ